MQLSKLIPKLIPIHQTKLFINNQFVDGIKRSHIPVIDPVTEEELCKISEATEQDIDLAVQMAEEAYQKVWSKTTQGDRNQYLNKIADQLEKNQEYLILLECLNTGRPYVVSELDMGDAVKQFRFYAGCTDKLYGKTVQNLGDVFCYTKREPYGVVACISPWNFPLLMALWKIAPALAAGNCVVVKPSEITPLTSLFFGQLVQESGLPAGVINIVPGCGQIAGHALSIHPGISKISFTGSTAVGRMILKASADSNLKKVSLELGGKSPVLIFADCDLEKTIEEVFLAAFWNSAQNCIAGSRIFVQDTIYDKFIEAYKQRVSQVKIGCFRDDGDLGPIINRIQFEKVLNFLQIAKDEGLECVTGGSRHGNQGFFIQPTIFKNVDDSSRLAREEIFGPVSIVLKPFKNVDEAIRRANDTPYGLCSAVFSGNMNIVEKCVRGIQAGTVYVNNYTSFTPAVPFGGYKQSGFGTDNGFEAVEDYSRVKTVYQKFDL